MVQSLWDTAGAVLRGNFIAIQAHLTKRKISNKQSNLTPKATRKRNTKSKVSRRKETTEIRIKINEIEMRNTIEKILK